MLPFCLDLPQKQSQKTETDFVQSNHERKDLWIPRCVRLSGYEQVGLTISRIYPRLLQTEGFKRRIDVFEMHVERTEMIDFFW